MPRPSRFLVLVALVVAPACAASKETRIFSIEAARPGFELPPAKLFKHVEKPRREQD